jgi:excisionase family DNA binding protein
MTHEGGPIGGTGSRLISVAEAAEILRVTEDAVRDWIATDRIPYVTLPGGEQRLELIDERHSHSGPVQQGITMIKTGVGKADEVSRKEFRLELAHRRREKQLIGLDGGGIDVDALAAALAERLAAVIPSQFEVTTESGMIRVLNDEGHSVGIDVAAMADDDGESLEERVCRAARHALDAPQDWIADETTEPWPARAGVLPGGFPAPNAEIVDEQVRLYYGDSGAPILELAPIRLRDVRSIAH